MGGKKVQIPPVVDVAVLQFQERWQAELSSCFFFFCCNAISRIISSCSKLGHRVIWRKVFKIFRFLRTAKFRTSFSILIPHPLLLSLLLPLVPHEIEEEEGVLVRVRQVVDRRLRNRTVHLHLQKIGFTNRFCQTMIGKLIELAQGCHCEIFARLLIVNLGIGLSY